MKWDILPDLIAGVDGLCLSSETTMTSSSTASIVSSAVSVADSSS